MSGDEEATWYVRPPSGGQYGPATASLLRQWISEGRVASTALLWREGWPQWRSAGEALPEYAGRLPDGPMPVGESDDATALQDERRSGAEDRPSPSTAPADSARNRSAWNAKTKRRVKTLGLLSALALALIVVLVVAIAR